MSSDYGAYRARVIQVLSSVPDSVIESFVLELVKARRVWIVGNGGSQATAQHFAEDLLTAGLRSQAVSDASFLTMAGNDFGYDEVFSRWLKCHADRGDVVVGISTSGRSPNVVKALKTPGIVGLGLIGCSASPLSEWCNVSIELGTEEGMLEVKVAEDVHLILGHMISERVRQIMDSAHKEAVTK